MAIDFIQFPEDFNCLWRNLISRQIIFKKFHDSNWSFPYSVLRLWTLVCGTITSNICQILDDGVDYVNWNLKTAVNWCT